MRAHKGRMRPILIYSMGQIAWIALLGLWIEWYVAGGTSGRFIGQIDAAQARFGDVTTMVFVFGLLFFAALLVSLTLCYLSLVRQMSINRSYDAFIASVSHELKSPLAAIRLHLETFRLRKPDARRGSSLVGLMIRDTDRLERLTNTALAIARLEQRRKVGEFGEHPAEALVRRIAEQTMADFSVTEWQFDSRACDSAVIRVNEAALKRVFDVLVDNAVKYSVGDVHLSLRCAVDRGRFLIEVEDEGIGIPKESLRKVFGKFYRVAPRTSPNVQGTGLGLFWAREIIRAHRGKITAESGGRRPGALFRITLPLLRKPER